MDKESAWKKFQNTGRIADYLRYCKECNKEENIGDADNN